MGLTDPAAVEEAYAAYEAAQARLATLDYSGLPIVVPPRSWRVPYAASGVMLDSLIS
ncbi:hypothetical protein [Mycolicibacterium mucogenicum]|uniref:hypothetical protein n=1 Tax=Mycolicibacterium mucogenicum TaxID=56689 RepID=UPI00140C232B|nr:hypothetical protein [Mycolicibacterium mucogenicum]